MRVVAALVVSLALASRADPIEDGLSWLRAQQAPDGELGGSRGEEPIVATTEAIATWKALGLDSQPETLAALSAMNASPVRADTELLLRRNLALQGTQWDFSVTTFSSHAEGFDSPENWLMAWSLLTGQTDAAWVTRAMALTARMDGQGCLAWADNGPSAEVTAMAVVALRRRSDVPGLNVARNALVTCLLTQQQGGGDFGSASATAMAVLALESVSVNVGSSLAAARAALLSMQSPDGSWGTVRATALAVRALGGSSPDWEARSEFGRAIVSMSAPTVLQGAVAQARAQFRNASGVAAPAVLVRFSLKQGAVAVTTQDVWLPPLAPGQLLEVSASLSTAGLAGSYQVEAEANALRLLPELDVNNNRATGTLSVLQQVDLALSQGSIQFVPDTATTVRARVAVQNLGSTLPAPATVSLWAFAARTGRALGSFVVPSGTPNGATVTSEVTFSTSDFSGLTAIHALVDPDNLVTEFDETNNATFRFFENGAQNLVDIGVTGLFNTTPSQPVLGEAFLLTGQVRNSSSNVAQRVQIAIIESSSLLVIGRTEIARIEPNQNGTFEVELAVQVKGELTLVIDPDHTLNETVLHNNTGPINFATLDRSANFAVLSAAFSNDRSTLTAQVQSRSLAGTAGVRVREVLSGAVVSRTTISLASSADRTLTFGGLDVADSQKVYEVCIDPEDQFPEAIETDNCAEAAVSAERSNFVIVSRNLRFAPYGAAVGERVTLTASARNDAALPFSFNLEFFQGRPGFPDGKFLGRSARVTAPAGGIAEASLEWIREDGPAEVYARIVSVNGRVDTPRRLVAGRHLFLEEIFDLGLTTNTSNGATAVRTGRVTGQAAPDLVVSYFVFGQPAGIALVSDSPNGHQLAWRRDLGTRVAEHALVDLEGDGAVEIVVLHNNFLGQSTLTVLDPTGVTLWSQVIAISTSGGEANVGAMALGDVNGDGIADIAYHSADGLTVRSGAGGAVLFNTLVFPILTGLNSFPSGSMYVADLDSDGQNEVVGVLVGRPYAVRSTGALWWIGENRGADFFALADLELDGEPELVFPSFRGPLIAVSSQTGLQKFSGPFTESWPAALAIGPVRQNGLPYSLTATNALDTRMSLHDPSFAFVWKRQFITPRVMDISLADLEGRGRPQAIYVHGRGGPTVFDARNGRTVLPLLGGEGNDYRIWHGQNSISESEPPVIADLRGTGTSSNIVLTSGESSGTAESNQLGQLANYYDGNILIYSSPHWKRQPTAWPTPRFVKGRIGEDLKLSNDYQWWRTNNTFNQQFHDVPATLMADVSVALPSTGPVTANQNVSLIATVTNVGGLPASQVPVAFYDGDPAEGGVLIGRTTVTGPLAINGGAAPASISWRPFPEGRHQLCVVVNEDGSVEEPDAEDNMTCREVLVRAPGPGCDLAVLQASLGVQPAAAQPGDAIALTATVLNVGAADCEATDLVLDDGPPSNQVRVGSLAVPSLSPGSSHSVAFSFLAVAGARQWRVTVGAPYDVNRSNDVATLEGFYTDALLPDLTVESLLVTTAQPAYPGEVIGLTARVRNFGAPSPATFLALTSGQRVPVPPLAAGETSDVTFEVPASAATMLVQANVDPDLAVAELDESNNGRSVTLAVTPAPLTVAAVAAPASAGPHSAIAITVQTTPAAGAAYAVTLSVSVVNSAGQPVATLLSGAQRVVAPAGQLESLSWNTGANPAGAYAIQVRAEAGGRLAGAASAPIQVLAGSPSITASLVANRGTVPAGGDVVLSFTARNTSGNLALSQLSGTLSVFDPLSQLVFREVRQVSSLVAGGVTSGAAVVSIGRSARPGQYTATLEFGDGTALLAQAGTSFVVQIDSSFTVRANLSAQASFQVGTLLPASVLLENFGAVGLSNQSLTVELLNAEAGLAVESMGAAVVTLGAGATQAHSFLLPTTGVPVGQKLLVARLEGRIVDTRPITALPLTDTDPPRIDISGVSDGDFTNQEVRPVVSVTDASAFTAVSTLDGAPFFPGDVVTAEGPHTLNVEAQDIFGNRSWVTVRFTIDLTPPVLVLNGPSDASLHLTAQTLAWTATDDAPLTTVGTLGSLTIVSGHLVATEGDFEWTVRAEDAAGNVTSETRHFAIDASAPVIALSAPPQDSYVNGPAALSWTVADAHPGSVVAQLDGNPVQSPATSTTEGLHSLTVTATDALGNVASVTQTFTIDDTPPTISVAGVVDGAVTRGPLAPSFAASDSSPHTVSATLDASPFLSGSAVTGEGAHELIVIARDAAENETSVTVRFTIDDTAPLIVITGVADGALLNTAVSPSFTVLDANPGTVTATLDGAPFTSGSSVAAEGAHELSVTAIDAAGNASTRTVRFELDFTAPVITVSGVTEGAVLHGPVLPVFSATDANLSSVSATLNGVSFASGTLVSADGEYLLEVQAHDGAGNSSSRQLRFAVDTTPPVIQVTGVTAGQVSATPLTPSFSATDAHLAQVSATLDGSPFVSGTPVTTEGAHVLVVSASDAAANTSTRTIGFELDFTAPTITISGVTNGASGASFTPVITSSGASSSSITLDGAPFTSGTTVTASGTHVLVATARDAAGNTTTQTVTFIVVGTGGQCVDLTLAAERRYSPHGWSDARHSFSSPIRVAVPWTLDVTAGNAGNKKAYLFFGLGGATTRCEYKGGSPVAHPTRAGDVAAGLSYRLDRCDNGVTAGALVMTDDVRLHVHEGDSKRGTTKASWPLQESSPCVGATTSDGGVPVGKHCSHDEVACEDDELEGESEGSGR